MVITENELLVHLNFLSTIHNLPFPYHLVNIQLKHSTTATLETQKSDRVKQESMY